MSALYSRTKTPIWCVGHAGHDVVDDPPLSGNEDLFSLEGQIRHKVKFLKEHVPHVYDEYVMERYKEGTIGKNVPKPDLTKFISKPKFDKKTVDLENLSSLNNLSHVVSLNKIFVFVFTGANISPK